MVQLCKISRLMLRDRKRRTVKRRRKGGLTVGETSRTMADAEKDFDDPLVEKAVPNPSRVGNWLLRLDPKDCPYPLK